MKTKKITLTIDIDINIRNVVATRIARLCAENTAHNLAKTLAMMGLTNEIDKIDIETEVTKI